MRKILARRFAPMGPDREEQALRQRLLEVLRMGVSCSARTEPERAQQQAREACRRALALLKESTPDPWQAGERGRGRFAFLDELSELWVSLRQRKWQDACGALLDLVYFHPMTRPMLRQQVIALLEEALEVEDGCSER